MLILGLAWPGLSFVRTSYRLRRTLEVGQLKGGPGHARFLRASQLSFLLLEVGREVHAQATQADASLGRACGGAQACLGVWHARYLSPALPQASGRALERQSPTRRYTFTRPPYEPRVPANVRL